MSDKESIRKLLILIETDRLGHVSVNGCKQLLNIACIDIEY